MFGKKERELSIEKEHTSRALKLALLGRCNDTTLKTVVTDSKEYAVIQIAGIKSVKQDKKSSFFDDEERDTLLITYLDETWHRLDMTVKSFVEQTGFKIPTI